MEVLDILNANGMVPKIILDVGANVGKTVSEWRSSFPKARIHAFEPITTTFQVLSDAHGDDRKVKLNNIALSDEVGEARMRAVPRGLANRILRDTHDATTIQVVQKTTGELYCKTNRIRFIDFLKIDAEGHDLHVLKGFEGMLINRSIKFLQVECGVSLENKSHISAWDVCKYLLPFGYGLVGLCDPIRRIPSKKTYGKGIYYCNAIFAAEDMSEREERLAKRALRRRAQASEAEQAAAPAEQDYLRQARTS